MDTGELFKGLGLGESGAPGGYSPLCLAYIGDSVFDLLVRTEIIQKSGAAVHELNQRAKTYVRAGAQAGMYFKLYDLLTEEERSVMKRGRNAKSYSRAKNATVSDYRHATGVEALFGFLYLSGRTERVLELFRVCVEG